MEIMDLASLAQQLMARAQAVGFALEGPVETEYGWGWEPTVSLWYNTRRMHYYYDSSDHTGLTVELAEHGVAGQPARGVVQTFDQAWNIVDLFLRQRRPITDLPAYGWKFDDLDHDKFIPQPPNTPNPANLATLFQGPGWELWQPPTTQASDQERDG